eukprot:TRINITY_DN4981_c0_g1_i1.p1 TRINITY_DN4981_c0_g1~~TRINITY_DN4981_c0_g1_i1.p1  ORF type:complete len:118 (-),score=20.39 TRINITY_DN4981_c0_g1_i1:73-426(-)
MRGGTFALNFLTENNTIEERLLLRVIRNGTPVYIWDSIRDTPTSTEQQQTDPGFQNPLLSSDETSDSVDTSSMDVYTTLDEAVQALSEVAFCPCSDSPFKQFQVPLPEFDENAVFHA